MQTTVPGINQLACFIVTLFSSLPIRQYSRGLNVHRGLSVLCVHLTGHMFQIFCHVHVTF